MGLAALVLGVLIAQIAFAGGGSGSESDIANLKRDNASLKQRISQLEARVGATAKTAKTAKKKKSKRGPQGPPGPPGVQGPPGPPGPAPACQGNGSGDEMVAAGAVCIDKYEATIWTAAEGGTQITGIIPCDADGQDCDNIFARSVPDVTPRGDITWFQAQRALANVGKRLPTNAEWQQAVAGTPDPGTTPAAEDCKTFPGGIVPTGSRDNCTSDFGAMDMVGNVWERVADWVPASTDCPGWPSFPAYGFSSDDLMCLAGASTTQAGPAALNRGGGVYDGAEAGPFAVDGTHPPWEITGFSGLSGGEDVGFRGAR